MNNKSELYGLTVFQADAAIKEFYSARADNMVAKNDMYSKISKYGYVYLDELSSDITKNQTLNTINTYLLGAGIKSDLVEDDATKAKEALRKQVLDAELKKMGNVVKEDTRVTTSREYAFIAVDDADIKRGYVNYEPNDDYNGKYVNLTLEGLERFIENNKIEGYNHYIKVPMEQVEIMMYDEPTEGAIIKLPFASDIEEYKNLNIRKDK